MKLPALRLSSENKTFLSWLTTLALPIMAQDLLSAGVNQLDSFMVGSLGLDAINGVGFANQIFFLFFVFTFGVNSGAGIYMGQYWGKGDEKSIRKVMGICFTSNMILAVVFAGCAFVIPQVLIGFYASTEASLLQGVAYLRLAAVTYFIVALTSTFNMALKSIGQTRLPMLTTFIGLLCNAGLNYLFIFVLHWGVMGAALATVLARGVELAAQLIVLRRLRIPVFGPLRDYFLAKKDYVKEYFKVTLPVLLNEAVWALGTTLYMVVYKICGDEAQGAAQIAATVQNVFMVAGFSTGSGCGIMLANLLGAGDRERAILYARKALKLVIAVCLVMGALLMLGAPLILSIYNVSDSVKHNAYLIMIVVALGLVFKTYNYTTIVGILRSGGDTTYCLLLDLAGVWAVALPLAWAGAALLHLPIYAVVALVYSEEIFKAVLSTYRVKSNIWARCVV